MVTPMFSTCLTVSGVNAATVTGSDVKVEEVERHPFETGSVAEGKHNVDTCGS